MYLCLSLIAAIESRSSLWLFKHALRCFSGFWSWNFLRRSWTFRLPRIDGHIQSWSNWILLLGLCAITPIYIQFNAHCSFCFLFLLTVLVMQNAFSISGFFHFGWIFGIWECNFVGSNQFPEKRSSKGRYEFLGVR